MGDPEYVLAAKEFRRYLRDRYAPGQVISATRKIMLVTGVSVGTAAAALRWLVEHGELTTTSAGSVVLPEPHPTTDELIATATRNLTEAARCLVLIQESLVET